MTDFTQIVDLEVNPPEPTGNLNRNPSAVYGLARYTTTGVTATAQGFDLGSGTAATMLTEAFPMAAGQWTDARYGIAARSSSAGFRRVTVTARYYTSAGAANGSAVVSQIVWPDASSQNPPQIEVAPAARQAPAGTATVRIEVAADAAANRLVLANIAIGVAATAAAATVGVKNPTWTSILAGSMSIKSEGGAEVDGVVDRLKPGSLVVTLKDVTLDPATSNALGRGGGVRFRRKGSSSIWTGTVESAEPTYTKDGKTTVTVIATDVVRDVDGSSLGSLPGGTFTEQVAAAAYAAGFGVQDKAGAFLPAATGAAASRDDSATAGDWITRAVATHGGAVYVDVAGRLRALTAADLDATPVTTFSDTAGPGLKYTALDLVYGGDSIVTALDVIRINLDEADDDGAKTYGPYLLPASETRFGRRSADVEILGGSASTIAARLLGPYATPRRYARSVTVNAMADLDAALNIRHYDAVRVKRGNLFDEVVRVIKIEHNLTPEGWLITYHLRPMEVAPATDLIVPPAGADTGPGDVAPPPAGPLSHRRRTTTFTVANNTTTTVPYNVAVTSDGIEWDASNNRWIMPKDGRVLVCASIGWSSNGTGARALVIRLNGPAVAVTRMNGYTGGANTHDKTIALKVKAGDVIYVTAVQTSGADLNITGDDGHTYATVTYLGA